MRRYWPVLLLMMLCGCGDDDPLACKVEEVEWIADGDTILDPNPPARGGGLRVFPDRYHPDEPLHDCLRVRARLSEGPANGKRVEVFFRLFDEDHYSSDPNFDPNGPDSANDNVRAGEPVAADVAAKLTSVNCSDDTTSQELIWDSSNRTAELGLKITHLQPGNNWKVAAHCSAFQAVGEDIAPPRPPENWAEQTRSPLLTVWRHLYVEIDTMDDPVFNAGPGQSQFDSGLAVKTDFDTVRLTLSSGGVIIPSQKDQFAEGKIELLSSSDQSLGIFDVFGNSSGPNPTVTVVTLNRTHVVPAATAKFRRLVDDDITTQSALKVTKSENMTPATFLWKDLLEPALVVPVFDNAEVAKENGVIPFDLHIGDEPIDGSDGKDTRALIKTHRGSQSTPAFWAVYQIGAFQGPVHREGDPFKADLGSAQVVILGGLAIRRKTDADTIVGTIVFAESLRESSEQQQPLQDVLTCRARASIHEIGHLFGMEHDAAFGDVMKPDAPCGQAARWTVAGLRKIMLTKLP